MERLVLKMLSSTLKLPFPIDDSLNRSSKIAYKMKQIYPPVLLTIGILGKIMSIFVLLRLRSSQPSIYLMSLACADLLALCVCVLPDWIGVLLKIEFREEYPMFFKLHTFGYFFSCQLSSWFLVLVTLERVVSVIYPYRVRMLFSFPRAFLSIILTIVCIVSLNMHFFVQKQDYIYLDLNCMDKL